jgi:hypothetical protein
MPGQYFSKFTNIFHINNSHSFSVRHPVLQSRLSLCPEKRKIESIFISHTSNRYGSEGQETGAIAPAPEKNVRGVVDRALHRSDFV